MLAANILLGCVLGIMACYIYLWHLRRTIQNKASLWKGCLVRLMCVALFFGVMFHICVPAGLAGFVTFILTRNFMLFKESRGTYGKL